MSRPLQTLGRTLALAISALALASHSAHAVPTLTAGAISAGFGISMFADGFPTTGNVGPLGIAFDGSHVIVSDYPGNVRVFATDVDGQHASAAPVTATLGNGNGVGMARSGNFLYVAEQSASQVVRLNLDGTFNSVVVTGLPTATGIFTNPVTGKLYVSDCCNNTGIWVVDPVTNTKTQFKNSGSYDGISMSADGSTLYAEINQHIIGYRLSDGGQVFDSGFIAGADGTELGSGTLAGQLFVNDNNGNLWDVSLATSVQTLLVTGGTRGDFVTADPNNGSLLFTQTSDIWRLTAPSGGCIGASCNAVPEPDSFALAGLALFGVAAIGRRRSLRAVRGT